MSVTCGPSLVRMTLKRIKKHVLMLELLNKHKHLKVSKAIIRNAESDFICSLCDCAYNILNGNVKLTAAHKKTLIKYKKHLRSLVNKKTGLRKKRQILQTGSGAFLAALLAPLASTVLLPLLRQVIG